MSLQLRKLKELLKTFSFKEIFLELNFSSTTRPSFEQMVGQHRFKVTPVAELGGLFVLVATEAGTEKLPEKAIRDALDRAISPTYTENLLIFINEDQTDSYFLRAVTVNGKRVPRGHRYMKG